MTANFLSFSLNFIDKHTPLFSSWVITAVIGIVLVILLLTKARGIVFLAFLALFGYIAFLYFTQPAPKAKPPEKKPAPAFKIADDFRAIHEELVPYFNQMGQALPDGVTAVALYPFTITGGGNPPILKYLTESMTVTLSSNKRMKLGLGFAKTSMGIPAEEIRVLDGLPEFAVEPELVRRQIQVTDSESGQQPKVVSGGQKAQFILFGKVTPIGRKVRLNVQMVDTDTAELLESFNHDIDKASVEAFLVNEPQ